MTTGSGERGRAIRPYAGPSAAGDRPAGGADRGGAECGGAERDGADPEPDVVRPRKERPRGQRLHPLTFVVGAVRELLALVAAGATGLMVGGLSTAFYFALAGLSFGLLFHVAGWLTFTYVLFDDRIELRRALIGRSVKSIPRDRIRGVDISASLPHRLLGLAVVHIDAGADGGEGALNAVSLQEAERLRRVLLSRDAPAPPRRVLARMRRRWYAYAPLSGAYLFTPFAVAGSLLGTIYNLGDDLGLITRERVESVGHDVVGLSTALVVALAILVLLAMPVMSVFVFMLFNWDFTVHQRDGSLAVERGLVTRRSVSLELRRLRGVELADNPFERAAGVTRLGALITGLGDAAHRGRLLPAAPRPVAEALAARVIGAVPGPLVAHPPAARSRRVTRAVGLPAAFAVLAVATGQPWAAYVFGVLAVLAVPLGLDRYRQLGHVTDGDRLSVRSGSLRRRQAVVEHTAIVGWRIRRTVFQRRLGLATLVAAVGAGDGGYSAIDMAEGDAVALAAGITPDWVTPFLETPPED
ncbi:PH domain-containing protein [Actinomadura livida]|uniref:PH domain-containing protein n=1 Tax=Actinomadura livida TaxID=79909 RepID=A0A7W7IBK7_9ACTN|nr:MULTISPECIES: PH domain-containing protein [Actinomadura]MBB4774043.1 putative membrane protein [Actinomadura catellatispora]GGT85264.1 membrane protein [Actinomadura livida]